jgi:hypothetical protein
MRSALKNARFWQVVSLTENLVKRLRPYVKMKHAGEEDDHAAAAFVSIIEREAAELKEEDFGPEVSC